MSIKAKQDFENLARTATRCRECFACSEIKDADIDVAQPRGVGQKYWESPFRVAVLMINPGRSRKNSARAQKFLQLIRGFRDGTTALDRILDCQRKGMEADKQFRWFYVDALGLDFDDIAFANVAWCATAANNYPGWMLRKCFELHTGPLLRILRPDVALASGSPVHVVAQRICELLPPARVIKMLHFKHREGRAAEQQELRRVGLELKTARAEGRRGG
jgi:hypothetical protein